MTTGSQAGESRGADRAAVPDTENYLDLSGVEDESPGPHFDVVLRGYDRRQVDEHVAGLRRMVAQLRAQLAVRERRTGAHAGTAGAGGTGMAEPSTTVRATPAARGADAVTTGSIEPVESSDAATDGVEAFNDRLRGILQAAEQEAHAVRSKAAETLLAEHAESRAALADLRSQRDAVVDELVRLRGWLDEIVSHPGRTPTTPPPVLTPGPPRHRPWSSPQGPPPGRPVAAPAHPGRYGAAPRPPGTGATAGPDPGGSAAPVDRTEAGEPAEQRDTAEPPEEPTDTVEAPGTGAAPRER